MTVLAIVKSRVASLLG